jgi:NADH-quinone oxidoreductase subunit K
VDLLLIQEASVTIFLVGFYGIFLNRKSIIAILISIELMLLAVNAALLTFSAHLDDVIGQLLSLMILTVAGGESAIGLAIIVVYYRIRGTVDVEFLNIIKG